MAGFLLVAYSVFHLLVRVAPMLCTVAGTVAVCRFDFESGAQLLASALFVVGGLLATLGALMRSSRRGRAHKG